MAMVGVVSGSLYRRTHSLSRLAWSLRYSTFIKWTGWTLAMALPWWQHNKHCRDYYYYTIVFFGHCHMPCMVYLVVIMLRWHYYAPACKNGAISVALSVHLSVAYTANNSRTQRPKFGMKVPHLRCDSHTSFKVKRSKVRARGGRGHTMPAELDSHTGC